MTSINVLAMLKNNLPAFRDELVKERSKLVGRIAQIDTHLKTANELAKVIGVEMAVVADDDYNET